MAAGAVTAETEPSVVRMLLLFTYGEKLFGVPADAVDGVVGWVKPSPLPAVSSRIQGIVHDRGRVVTVLHRPDADPPAEHENPKRLVLCRTERGLLGLPAVQTRSIASVELAGASGALVDSSEGPLVLVDPEELAKPRGGDVGR
jgi:chemotaxis signal transduction protein